VVSVGIEYIDYFMGIVMKKITVAHKLYAIAVIVALGILIMLWIEFTGIKHIERLEESRIDLQQIEITMLQLRRNEKDFLARNTLKYQEKYHNNFQKLDQIINQLITDMSDEGMDVSFIDEMKDDFEAYKSSFDRLVKEQKVIGLHSKDGLYGSLRVAVHKAETGIKELKDDQLMADMLMLRRREKDFMLRLDLKYLDKFKKDITKFMGHLDDKDYSHSIKESIRSNMQDYQKNFVALIEASKAKGLDSKSGLLGEMRKAVHKTETLLDQIDQQLSKEVPDRIKQQEVLSLSISVIILLVITVMIVWIARNVSVPVRRLANVMAASCQDKDLSLRVEVKGSDEIAEMSTIFNTMMEEFENVLREIVSSASQVNIASDELTQISESTSEGVQKQFQETDMLATSMNEMTATVQEVARHAQDAANTSAHADEEAQNGKQSVQENRLAIEQVASEISTTTEVINELSHESENIGTVLNVIRDIAEQTNLLALNAAIEAARAGEQGRGFAVVADEVRGLAQRSQQSTQEIQDIVERLQDSAGKAVAAMENGNSKAKDSVVKAESVTNTLDAITSAVSSISDMNIQIASAAEEQSAVAEEINRSVTSISNVAGQTTENSNMTTNTSEQLATLSNQLAQVVSQFKLG